ncbi:hypothetical protein ACFQBQ_08345 [Granulicella cerasi]|uniref:Uncharacterized protein n=1 Tax=Granulicella cerasi TaxID=741063 RepID=A0ABW1ZAY1_9BACT|nr:hypothetical protein [Granulicella cerasi]
MPSSTPTTPIEDSVPKIDEKIAVGENLEFQRTWWKFERVVWTLFLLILIADVLGVFGRGWLSKGRVSDAAQTLTVDYEHVARASTPSIMTLHFGPNAIHNGHVQLYVSDSIVKPLGAQRISPQPAVSSVGRDGITYTFDATELPASVQIALEPSFPGRHPFKLQVVGGTPVQSSIIVVP